MLVIGGGIGGGAAAAFLRQSGYAVIAERPRNASPGGLLLAGNGARVLAALGLELAGQRIDAQEVRDSKGQLLSSDSFQEEHAGGGGPVGLLRSGLEEALWDAARAELLPGVELEELRQDHALVATARGQERVDLVVAADGPASALRRRFLPEPAFREAPQVLLRFLSRTDAEPRLVRVLGNGVTLVHFPVSAGVRGGVAITAAAEVGADPAALRGALGPAGSAVLEGLVPGSLQRVPLLDGLAPSWSRGALVLLGGAAHGLHPGLGQGAAMAIEDARALQVALDGASSVPAALQAYEAMRRERVAAVHRAGWEQAEATRKGSLFSSVRGLLHRMFPSGAPDRKLSTLLLGEDLGRLLSHRPELAPLTPEARGVLRFLVKIGQVDGHFDETERAFARAALLEIGHQIAGGELEALESETRFRSAGSLVEEFLGHTVEFRERLLRMGVLLAAASGRVTSDEHKALRDACDTLQIPRETLEAQVREAIEAQD